MYIMIINMKDLTKEDIVCVITYLSELWVFKSLCSLSVCVMSSQSHTSETSAVR